MVSRKFCPDCGQPHHVEARFCGNCGRAFPIAEKSTPTKTPSIRWKTIVGIILLLIVLSLAVTTIVVVLTQPDNAIVTLFRADATPVDEPSTLVAAPGLAAMDATTTPTIPPAPSPTTAAPPTPTAIAVQPDPSTMMPTELSTISSPTISEPMITSDISASRTDSPPNIDGDLSEWLSGSAFLTAHQVYAIVAWDGSDDVEAVWQLLWDDAHLYIGAIVTDDTHVQTQFGRDSHKGDSLELQIDTDRLSDLQATQLSTDDFQIVLSPGNFVDLSPSAYRFRGSLSGQIEDAPGHAIAVVAQRTPTGYTLEAVIPWSDLAVTPRPGLVLGLALNVNDNDTPGTAAQELMKSSALERTLFVPSSWGTLTLQSAIDAVGNGATATDVTVIEGLVHALQAHNEFGVAVETGQMVHIEYVSGSWRAGPSPTWPLVGPTGDVQVAAKATFPVPESPIMSLVGGMGDSQPFAVSDSVAFISNSSGVLWLGANDDDFSDNTGSLLVRITIEN